MKLRNVLYIPSRYFKVLEEKFESSSYQFYTEYAFVQMRRIPRILI